MKEIIEIREEINKIENRNSTEDQETKFCFFEKNQ